MYTIKYDLSMVHKDEMGVNAPMDHQRIISKLNAGLGKLFYYDKTISLEPLPETMIDPDRTSPTPDLLLYDNQIDRVLIVIEICHTIGLKRDLQKIYSMIENDQYDILEGFVFNYKTAEWFRYRKGDGGLAESSSFSEILQLDLNSFL
ncbi:hypothetical protein [Larkinella rosea]|uniref:GxxExxY protein n=1 Tax=Larkinella rosea TaxID=2025312 RepID=A0A3P1BFV2_9BACT|nr:hypothetical protein [Larkinella rosea]RRA99967.1 hypothetical protein EHT25_25400 [Larkinella rosea]